MKKKKSYHQYVFNVDRKQFVGNFEEMYKKEKIDPWYSSDLSNDAKKIHSALLSSYSFNSILDYGCGKGVFTHTLKKNYNKVYGVDISKNVIKKAMLTYGHIVNFSTTSESKWLKKKYDLIICLEVLSYVKKYKELLRKFSVRANYLYLSLYVPKNPIGFVKNIDELINNLKLNYSIKSKIIYNDESVFILAKSKLYKKKSTKLSRI